MYTYVIFSVEFLNMKNMQINIHMLQKYPEDVLLCNYILKHKPFLKMLLDFDAAPS